MTDPLVVQANATYRDYVTDGVPSSGANNPAKSDIRALWVAADAAIETASAAGSASITVTNIQAFGGADDGATSNVIPLGNAVANLPAGSRIGFPLKTAGSTYAFAAGAFGLTPGYLIDPAPNTAFSGMTSKPYADVTVTRDLKFEIPAVSPTGSYTFTAAANFQNALRNKSLWIGPENVDRSVTGALDATSASLTHAKVSWPSSDTWTAATPSSTSKDTVNWSLTTDGYFYGSFIPGTVGQKLTCFFPSNLNYLRAAIIRSTGGYQMFYFTQANGLIYVDKVIGSSVVTNAVSYFDYTTNLNYYGTDAELSLEVLSVNSFVLLVNGMRVGPIVYTNGNIQYIGFGAYGEITGPTAVPVQGWITQSRGAYGGLQPFQFLVCGDSKSDPSFHSQWPWYAQEALNGSLGSRCIAIDNRAVVGSTAYAQYAALLTAGVLNGGNTACAVIYLGTNDIQGQTPLGGVGDTTPWGTASSGSVTNAGTVSAYTSSFIGTLYALAGLCVSNGVSVVFVVPGLFYNQAQTPGGNGQATSNYGLGAPYRAAVKRLAAANGFRCVDPTEIEGPISGQFLNYSQPDINDPIVCDNIHYTAAGSRLLGYAIAKAIAATILPRPDDISLMGGVHLAGDAMTGPLGIVTSTVANLPTSAIVGEMYFASNARVFNGAGTQESAGVGTGGLVTWNGSAWKLVGTNSTAIA